MKTLVRGSVLCLVLAVAAFGQHHGGGSGSIGGGGFHTGSAFRGGGGFRGGYGYYGGRRFFGRGFYGGFYGGFYPYSFWYPYGYGYPYYCDPYSGYGCYSGYAYGYAPPADNYGYSDPPADPYADPPSPPPTMQYRAPSAAAPPAQQPGNTRFSIALKNGVTHTAVSYWAMSGVLYYVDTNGEQHHLPISMVDRARSVELNESRGIDFALPTGS